MTLGSVDGRGIAIKRCQNENEAQALCNFLWNEGQRHKNDIADLELDIRLLKAIWGVEPVQELVFMTP